VGGSKARKALDFKSGGSSSLGALQKFTPMIIHKLIGSGRRVRSEIWRVRSQKIDSWTYRC